MRASLLSLVLALGLAGAAAADHLDPQERIRAADQKRAVSMLLRKSDLPVGYDAERTSGLEPHLACRALDESSLVLTGTARSPYWERDFRIVGSSAAVYRTTADSAAAWRRSTSAGGRRCIGAAFESELARQGESVRVAVVPLDLPALGVSAYGYRVSISGTGSAQTPVVVLDIVLLRHGRAQAGVAFASVVVAPDRAQEASLSHLVATRMKAAMRGA